jgi:hypothetical protein
VTRGELEHVIRAAGTIADVDDLVIIGSQSVLGQFPDAPSDLLVSNEADVFSLSKPDRSDLIDSTIGEGSPFQREFGYYAHGVGPETAVLPAGWRERLVLVCGENTRFVKGLCLEVHDLAIAKYVAGREKDLDFTGSLISHRMVRRETLEQRLLVTNLKADLQALVIQRIARQFRKFA